MPKSVLVVDDDRAIRSLVRVVLEREKYQVAEAATGNEAIALLRRKSYKAIVLDLMMGEGTGEDVLTMLAEERPNAKCVVVISAMSAAMLEKTKSMNIVAKLRKPFDINDLANAVRRCVDA